VRELTPTEQAAIRAALSRGDKIEAIKLCRDGTGSGLAEAKEIVERLEGATQVPPADPTKVASENEAALAELSRLLFAGRKIDAIKFYREKMKIGAGLAESKEQVDRLESALRARSPEKFTMRPQSGCVSVLTAVAAVVAMAAWLAS